MKISERREFQFLVKVLLMAFCLVIGIHIGKNSYQPDPPDPFDECFTLYLDSIPNKEFYFFHHNTMILDSNHMNVSMWIHNKNIIHMRIYGR